MSGQDLRRRYIRQFSSFERPSAFAAWGLTLLYVLTLIICLGVGYELLSEPVHASDYIMVSAIVIFMATRLRGLNNIVHECSHSTFCSSRKHNVIIGKLCASIILKSFTKYRKQHLSHHAHLGDPNLDDDFKGIADLGLEQELTRPTILRHALTPFLGRHLQYYVSIDLSDEDGHIFKWLRVSLLFAGIFFTAIEPVAGVMLVLTPFLFVFSALNYWADCIDHAGLISSKDELDASRNVILPSILRLLLFPRHDSYHLVHHLFPVVPAKNLAESHDILKSDPYYVAKVNAVGKQAVSKGPLPWPSPASN